MTSQIAAAPGLTDEQRRIVEWGDGPLVVIAGAGTGKTRVIVERVRWLLDTRGAATIVPARPDLRCWCDDAALCPQRVHTGAVKV
jgi:hypothetical protein